MNYKEDELIRVRQELLEPLRLGLGGGKGVIIEDRSVTSLKQGLKVRQGSPA